MAKKGQKFNRYPEEFKEALRQAYLNGEETCNSIARKYSGQHNRVGIDENIQKTL